MIRRLSQLVLAALLVAFAIPAIAGTARSNVELSRAMIETQRQAIVTDNLELTDAEAKAFWPVYREYQNGLRKVNDQRVSVLESYAKNYDTMTDEKADKILRDYLAYQNDYLKVRKSYVKKFQNILPATKVAKFYQIENKMDAVINYELAANIPLVQSATNKGQQK